MRKAQIWLPFPRVVVGTVRRCSRPERLAVIDTVPVDVPDLKDADAPVALRLTTRHAVGCVGQEEFREFGGEVYRAFRGGLRPEAAAAALGAECADLAGANRCEAAMQVQLSQPLHAYHVVYHGVSRQRGCRPEEDHRIATVHDDGRAAQAEAVARVASSLVLVDGILHHRAPMPVIDCDLGVNGSVVLHSRFASWGEGWEAAPSRRPWLEFPAGRLDEATSFTRENRGEPDILRPVYLGRMPEIEVVDRAAYDRAEASYLAGHAVRCAAAAIACAAACIGFHSDDALAAFGEARRALRAGRDVTGEASAMADAIMSGEAQAGIGQEAREARAAIDSYRSWLAFMEPEASVDLEALSGISP